MPSSQWGKSEGPFGPLAHHRDPAKMKQLNYPMALRLKLSATRVLQGWDELPEYRDLQGPTPTRSLSQLSLDIVAVRWIFLSKTVEVLVKKSGMTVESSESSLRSLLLTQIKFN